MNPPDFKELLLSIKRCNASYIMDDTEARKAFLDLGAPVLARLSTDHVQAVISRPKDGILTLTICGSRVTEGTLGNHIHDLLTDFNCDPFDIESGRMVAEQPFKEAWMIYNWLFDVNSKEPVRIEGHSLGGWRSVYATEFLPAERIISITAWESPKQGNDAYWADLEARGLLSKITQVYHGADPWGFWPFECDALNHGPAPMLWLYNNSWSWVTASNIPQPDFLNGYNLEDSADHGPDTVIAAVQSLAEGVQ